MVASRRFVFFFLLFLASAALSAAHIGHFDDHWRKRQEDARAAAAAAYQPDTDSVLNSFNDDIIETITRHNGTRRSLKDKNKHAGPCIATNPIDRCWRCRADWANDRKRLASCAKGFGRHTTGGLHGEIYVVTDPSDDELVNPLPGTLRWGVVQDRPLWIIFARSMVIKLSQELIVNSNKTIDGRGAQVHIAFGAGFMMQMVDNIIIHNINIHDIKPASGGMIRDSMHHYGFRTVSDGDGISIFGATNIWIDHISMSNCDDGLIDVIENSTAVTISNSHFTRHDHVMLFGARDSNYGDSIMQVTSAFNHFGRGLSQRMPRCRWGFIHLVNNDYTHWLMYALGGSAHPTIISQGNRFIAPPNLYAKEVTKRMDNPESVWMKWTWRSEGDILRNGAFFRQSGSPNKKKFLRNDFIKHKPATYVARLTRYSGTLPCKVGKAC